MLNTLSRVKIGLVLVLLAAGLARADANYIKPEDVPWETILTGPPPAGGDVEKAEIAKLLEWQNKRTATDETRCQSEAEGTAFVFSDVLGDKFTEKSLPVTAKLLKDAATDIKAITKAAKTKWDRKRPPAVDSRIKPCVPPELTNSYPSSHAVRGVVWTTILAEIFPGSKDKLLERGKLMGEDRVIAGIHFPSDVEAGQALGKAIAKKLLSDPKFQAALKDAKDECENAGIAK